MTTNEIRSKFLDFMKTKGHAIIPSAPVYLEDDPTVLFTTAGMQPLIPYLLGKPHPQGKRLANSQKCIRTVDIDEVGDNSHLTMFEMLGNWGLGDYFKDDAIAWSFEFLTDKKWLGLDPDKLYITVYKGDDQVSKDSASIKLWQQQFKAAGIEATEGERILALGKDDNWWEIGGTETSPAGPDTEMFYYVGSAKNPQFDPDDSDFIEIWNDVFMAYQRQADGSYTELANKNVDTGMGLERVAAVIQGKDSVFQTDIFTSILKVVYAAAHKIWDPGDETSTMVRPSRIIADHVRTSIFMAADGVTPSNTERGYVMRRLIRRAVRQGLLLGITTKLFSDISGEIIDLYIESYPELQQNKAKILAVLEAEEQMFRRTLERGVREFKKIVQDKLDGAAIFELFDTYGFPPELSVEEAAALEVPVDAEWPKDFDRLMTEQKARSRTATVGIFKGGLVDQSEATVKLHTATHLMYQALRQVLGDNVVQRGSNITPERLRFDFSHDAKMTDEQKREVEQIVNEQIDKDLKVWFEEHPTDEAFKLGAKGAFGDKYGDTVKVYFMGREGEKPFSIEICGGPHVEHTGVLGKFRIQKEESSSAGVRRIKAVLE